MAYEEEDNSTIYVNIPKYINNVVSYENEINLFVFIPKKCKKCNKRK